MNPSPRLLIVSSGAMGMRRQLQAVAEGMHKSTGAIYQEWIAELRWPWACVRRSLPKQVRHEWIWASPPPIDTAWDVILSCGRRGALAARALGQRYFNDARLVHIEDPRYGHHDFDLLLIPAHDQGEDCFRKMRNLSGRVAVFHGALSPFTGYNAPHHSVVDRATPPRFGLIIGGSGKGFHMTRQWADDLVAQIRQINEQAQGAWLITFSRRTQSSIRRILERGLGSMAWIWDGTEPNPYPAMIQRVEHLIVSIDSTSMVLQAAASPAALFLLDVPGGRAKIDRLTDRLLAEGRACWFSRDALADNVIRRPDTDQLRCWDSVPLACDAIATLTGTTSTTMKISQADQRK